MKRYRVPLLAVCLAASFTFGGDASRKARWGVLEAAGTRTVAAKPGEVASGVVVFEDQNELRLRVDPCRPSDVIVFYAPFVKVRLGPGGCGGQAFDRFQVEKQ